MTRKINWYEFAMLAITAVIGYFTVFPRVPVQPACSATQMQLAQKWPWIQSLEQDWLVLFRYFSAVFAGCMVVLAGWLNVRAARHRGSAPSVYHRTVKTAASHLQLERTEPVGPPIAPFSLPGSKIIDVGTRVRLCPPSDADKQRSPKWVPGMDKYIGQEFVVESRAPNGLLRLDGLKYDVSVVWVEPTTSVVHVNAD